MSVYRYRRPTRLKDLAFDVLGAYVGHQVVQLGRHCTFDEVRRGIALLKSQITDCLPWTCFSEFAEYVLDEISKRMSDSEIKLRLKQHGSDWLDIVLDDRVEKLLYFPRASLVLTQFMGQNAPRLRRLKHLEMVLHMIGGSLASDRDIRETYTRILSDCTLDHLTVFVCPNVCSDDILSLVASKAPNLEEVSVSFSDLVTPKGVLVLGQCRKLRVLNLVSCSVDFKTIFDLLCTHSVIVDLTMSQCNLPALEDLHESGSVYPFLGSLNVPGWTLWDAHLRNLVGIFPGLRTLGTGIVWCEDFSDSDFLKNIPDLYLGEGLRCDLRLWPLMGPRIVEFSARQPLHSSDLEVINEFCSNMRIMDVRMAQSDSGCVSVPAFEKLQHLAIASVSGPRSLDKLSFGPMLSLESLDYADFYFIVSDLKAILLDFDNFPRLRMIQARDIRKEDHDHIVRVAKANNLDLYFPFGDIKQHLRGFRGTCSLYLDDN